MIKFIHSKLIHPALAVEISTLDNPASNLVNITTIGEILAGGTGFSLINIIFFIAGTVFFFSLAIAGWQYMLSSGDPKKIAQASGRLNNSIIGLIVVIASFLITNVIATIIGADSIF